MAYRRIIFIYFRLFFLFKVRYKVLASRTHYSPTYISYFFTLLAIAQQLSHNFLLFLAVSEIKCLRLQELTLSTYRCSVVFEIVKEAIRKGMGIMFKIVSKQPLFISNEY